MRTRGAVEDLVVVDLDDPDDVASRGPAAQRRHFEDHYAELPFGLGTVARRLDHTPWYTRPGAIAWIALALIGLVALAGGTGGGRDEDRGRPSSRPVGATAPARASDPPDVPELTVVTGVRLGLYHVGTWTELDVDRKTLRPITRSSLPPDLAALSDQVDELGVLPPRAPASSPNAVTAGTVCLSMTAAGWRARLSDAGGCAANESEPAAFESRGASTADGRWLFVPTGSELLAIDTLVGHVHRVDVALPPFEALFVL